MKKIRVSGLIGKGYNRFWKCRKRYLAVKGGRASKKSYNTAVRFIYLMTSYWKLYHLKPYLLVIRRVFNTHKNSTRAQLITAINRLHQRHLWNIPKGENTLTYLPSGQQILFRGMDDPQSITSITVDDGYLCWVWFEEAFQITSEDDFNKIDMSIRGNFPKPIFKQIVLTFNPWSDKSWLKKRFFDNPDENTLALTTTYKMNEFIGEDDKKLYEDMKKNNPKRYRIEGEGEWGISEGLIFENWEVKDFDMDEVIAENNSRYMKNGKVENSFICCNGIDFGYTDPTAFVAVFADRKNFIIYIYDEFCETMLSDKQIANKIIGKGFGHSQIIADSEDPKTIAQLKTYGVKRIEGAKKGPGSVLGGIMKLNDYRIIVHPTCENTIIAFNNYAWKKDKLDDSKNLPEPEHEFSHIPDALRYGCEKLERRPLEV